MGDIFDMEFERTEFSDENYAVVGRAFAYAQKFEGDVKALRLLVHAQAGLDSSLFDDEEAFHEFVNDLHGESLYKQVNNVVDRLGLNSADKTLQLARQCRNEIAHAICLGIQQDIESDEGRQRLIGHVSDHIHRIAEAHLLILLIMALLTSEDVPRPDYLDAFCDRVVEWVCATEGE